MKETNRFPSTHLVTISSFKDLVSYPNDSDLSWHEKRLVVNPCRLRQPAFCKAAGFEKT
ncbi:hypothetical protein [Desulfosarcina sp. BuS5]|uniref:hypothetical protein n=1 Tax=Desulfosarcina sp. BuS5 TaxID=933262 RepID=UPI002379004E|nr:hypothetical protein [Desulfosarcina sp. BuS5]